MNERVVLVTGGAGNLGRAVTRAFLQAGARVAIPFHKTDKPDILDELKHEHEGRIFTFDDSTWIYPGHATVGTGLGPALRAGGHRPSGATPR